MDNYFLGVKNAFFEAFCHFLPMETIQRAVDDFPRRLKACIEAEGGHFENK